MSKDKNVIVVHDIKQLPYAYIPYHSITQARDYLRKRQAEGQNIDPNATLYHFVSPVKEGWQIVAYPVVMIKPAKEEADEIETSII